MIMAKWLLFALLALPGAELLVFILVAIKIGLAWALAATIATSLLGAVILRASGGAHIARMKVVLGADRMSAIEADATGTAILIAGFLLLIPGFITDVLGLLLLVPPVRRLLGHAFRHVTGARPARRDGVVDLEPDEWRQVPDREIPDQRERDKR